MMTAYELIIDIKRYIYPTFAGCLVLGCFAGFIAAFFVGSFLLGFGSAWILCGSLAHESMRNDVWNRNMIHSLHDPRFISEARLSWFDLIFITVLSFGGPCAWACTEGYVRRDRYSVRIVTESIWVMKHSRDVISTKHKMLEIPLNDPNSLTILKNLSLLNEFEAVWVSKLTVDYVMTNSNE